MPRVKGFGLKGLKKDGIFDPTDLTFFTDAELQAFAETEAGKWWLKHKDSAGSQ